MMIRTLAAAAGALSLNIGLVVPSAVQAQQPDALQVRSEAAPLHLNHAGSDRPSDAQRERLQNRSYAAQGYAGSGNPGQGGHQHQTQQRTRMNEHNSRGQGSLERERQRAPAASAGRR